MGFSLASIAKIARETFSNLRQAPVRWRDRDRELVDFVAEHPATTDQLARTFFTSDAPEETGRKKASRRLNRLRRRRLINVVGMVQLRGTGRPQYVYCGWQPRTEQLEHEIWITELRLIYRDFTFHRSTPVGMTIADALLEKNGTRFFIELDTGTMGIRQMESKWRKYPEDLDGFVLVVCLYEKRMERLRKQCDSVRDFALFSTFERLESDQGDPWIDASGESVSI